MSGEELAYGVAAAAGVCFLIILVETVREDGFEAAFGLFLCVVAAVLFGVAATVGFGGLWESSVFPPF